MRFFWQGLQQGWHLILTRDPYLTHLFVVTIKVLLVSTGAAALVGLPVGLVLALGRFRGRGVGIALANAGLGLPPVVVGLTLALLMFPEAPLGRFRLLYTLHGVYIAQALLALPVIVALTVSAVRDVASGLLDQARALGASRVQVAVLATREARIGIVAAIIAAGGSALSEVGAVVLVGGNIRGTDQTLASAALEQTSAGNYALGMAVGIILIGFILVLGAVATVLQYGNRQSRFWIVRAS